MAKIGMAETVYREGYNESLNYSSYWHCLLLGRSQSLQFEDKIPCLLYHDTLELP